MLVAYVIVLVMHGHTNNKLMTVLSYRTDLMFYRLCIVNVLEIYVLRVQNPNSDICASRVNVPNLCIIEHQSGREFPPYIMRSA